MWPHQERAIRQFREAVARGAKRICITAPTGAGKSLIMREIVREMGTATVYLDRAMLFEQTDIGFETFDAGYRAAGRDVDYGAPVQICMRQTEYNRVIKEEQRDVHDCKVVLWDEAHNQSAEAAQALMNRHAEKGAVNVGFTATPCGLGHVYDELIVAGTPSEMRKCGAHVPAYVYAPNHPDLSKLGKKVNTEDVTESIAKKAMRATLLYGRIIEHWERLNPERRLTIGFAPGVKESKWMAQQFEEHGISAAHISGDEIVIRGEEMPATTENRERLLDAVHSGDVQVVWNRFVLREGIDIPQVGHAILATVFGSLTAYLQSVGRVVRAHPSLDSVCIQDHGGNYLVHGSPNADRVWDLDKSDRDMVKERRAQLQIKDREDTIDEGITCPECAGVRKSGKECPHCGHRSTGRTRMIVQTDGKLKQMHGDAYAPKRVSRRPQDEKDWIGCIHRCKRSGQTFGQAAGLFVREHRGAYPDTEKWAYMPRNARDWAKKIKDVPTENLT